MQSDQNQTSVRVNGEYAVQPDGSLYASVSVHIAWRPGDRKIFLTGYFTATELRDIAAYMETKPSAN